MLLDILVGALLTVMAYSSLAIVLLTATLAAESMIPSSVALGLVIGANVGSGILAVLATSGAAPEERRLPVGNLVFKLVGAAVTLPLLPQAHTLLQEFVSSIAQQVVVFHLGFNCALAGLFLFFTGPVGGWWNGCCRRRARRPATARTTWTRWRWPRLRWPSAAPRARRCTRPTWWRPCCAPSCP